MIFNLFERFCKAHPGELHKRCYGGWHIKAGFSTGAKINFTAKKARKVLRMVKCVFKRPGNRPYAFVTETMSNTKVNIQISNIILTIAALLY